MLLYYGSVMPDQYRSVPIFTSDRPSVAFRPDIFRYDFCHGERFERSDSESDARRIGELSIRSRSRMKTHIDRHLSMILRLK